MTNLFSQLYNYSLPPKWQHYTQQHAGPVINANGNLARWLASVQQLPAITSEYFILDNSVVTVGTAAEIPSQLKQLLLAFSPWRKGPYSLFGIDIDTEWRSDWKWDRLTSHINLTNKRVLDVGCGNGYHLWRMLGAGAKQVLGIEPNILFIIQFLVLRDFMTNPPSAMILPFKLEDLAYDLELFDIIFSMGVLYHRRSPLDHLAQLKSTLIPGGELILETLVVDGELGFSLMPSSKTSQQTRYAKMRNVWFIPTVATLELWLTRLGFVDIELLDVSVTTTAEQRSTEWMEFESLADFLNPNDNKLTIENYPAPKRAILKAINKG